MSRPPLLESDVDPDPLVQFRRWYAEAAAAEPEGADAMVLATASTDGAPSARTVLFKDLDERGFGFVTNYDSRKGREIAANPRVSLVFLWRTIRRQVLVRGTARRASAEVSDAYFATRARGSRLGAWASPQSEVVADRAALDALVAEVEARFGDRDVPRPPHWGGVIVEPAELELWQGRDDRLHDRLRYRRGVSGEWVVERLAP